MTQRKTREEGKARRRMGKVYDLTPQRGVNLPFIRRNLLEEKL